MQANAASESGIGASAAGKWKRHHESKYRDGNSTHNNRARQSEQTTGLHYDHEVISLLTFDFSALISFERANATARKLVRRDQRDVHAGQYRRMFQWPW